MATNISDPVVTQDISSNTVDNTVPNVEPTALVAADTGITQPTTTASDLAIVQPTTPSTPDPVVEPTLPVQPTQPTQPAQPTQPTEPTQPTSPMTFDVIASQSGGDFSVAVSDKTVAASDGSSPIFSLSSGTNNLNVSETAQQNLEALVNVNAAGSVVPIQLNLTVLINSSVENLNASNTMDLSSYSTFQLQ